LNQVDADDIEKRLSILARWITDAERTHADYGLRLPQQQISPANGAAHRHRCLEALALFDLSQEASA
jgi:uncharacterized protein (DUF58 family)